MHERFHTTPGIRSLADFNLIWNLVAKSWSSPTTQLSYSLELEHHASNRPNRTQFPWLSTRNVLLYSNHTSKMQPIHELILILSRVFLPFEPHVCVSDAIIARPPPSPLLVCRILVACFSIEENSNAITSCGMKSNLSCRAS